MKKLLLFLLLSLGLSTISYAGPYDDWPDDAVCMWLDIKPTHAGYLGEAKKRGISCEGGVAVKTKITSKVAFPTKTTINWGCNRCNQNGITKQVHLPEDVLSGLSYEEYTLSPDYPDYMMNVLDKSDGHPVRAGNKSIRFEIRPGDCFKFVGINDSYESGGEYSDCTKYPLIEGQGDRERFELQSEILEKKEHWFSWSIFFPEDFKNNWPYKNSFGQFKELGGSDPIWMFEQFKNGIGVTLEGGINGEMAHFNLLSNAQAPGKWHDIIIHSKFSKNDDGFFKVWVNNALKVNYKGATMKAKDVVHKFGIYRTGISRYANQKNLKGLKKCVLENESHYFGKQNNWEEHAIEAFTDNWEINHDWSKILYEKCNGYYDEIELPNDVVYYDEIRRADSCEELGSLHECSKLSTIDSKTQRLLGDIKGKVIKKILSKVGKENKDKVTSWVDNQVKIWMKETNFREEFGSAKLRKEIRNKFVDEGIQKFK